MPTKLVRCRSIAFAVAVFDDANCGLARFAHGRPSFVRKRRASGGKPSFRPAMSARLMVLSAQRCPYRVSDPLAAAASRSAAQVSASERTRCVTYLARRQATPKSCPLRLSVSAASASAADCKSCSACCLSPSSSIDGGSNASTGRGALGFPMLAHDPQPFGR